MANEVQYKCSGCGNDLRVVGIWQARNYMDWREYTFDTDQGKFIEQEHNLEPFVETETLNCEHCHMTIPVDQWESFAEIMVNTTPDI